MKELIAAQLVAEEAEDVFVFRHALTREAIRTKLLLRERRALSRQIAQAIETLHGGNLESWLEDLAWHYNEAGDWAKASQYAREAGARALALYTPTAAAVHLTQAVDAGRRVDGTMMAEVFRLRGIAYEGAGDLEAARADYEQAISLAEAEGDHTTRWRALLDLGLFWSSRDFQQSGPYLRAALDVAREHGDAAALGHSLNRLGNWYSNTGDIDMARQMGEEALATFRAAGNQEGEAQTLDVLGMTSYQALELARGAAYYRQAIPLLQAIGDRRILTSALASIQIGSGTYQTDMLPPVLSLKEGSEYGEQALALARQSGSRSAESYALWHLVLSLGPQGEYARALTYGREALTIAHDTGHTQWDVAALCALSTWFLDLLATDDALRYLARAAARLPEIRSKLWDGQVDSLLLDTFVCARRIDEAAKLVASLPPSKLEMCTSFGDCQRYTSIAEFRLAQGDLDRTFAMLARLAEVAEHAVPGGAALRLIRLRGRALAAAGDHEEAIRCLRGAEALARQRGNLSYTWRLNVDLAAVLLAAAARDAARMAAGQAIEIIESLAPRIPEQPLREQFIARALDMLPAALRHQPARDDAGLTGREAEVAALVAQGHTNREIADRLVISVRTVETHVANAIAKLGLANRAQLAGWAVEHGLRTADT